LLGRGNESQLSHPVQDVLQRSEVHELPFLHP
jgi:hypothetical protein